MTIKMRRGNNKQDIDMTNNMLCTSSDISCALNWNLLRYTPCHTSFGMTVCLINISED